MNDLPDRLASMRQHVKPRWSAERERRVASRVERALVKFRRHRLWTCVSVVIGVAVCALLWQRHRSTLLMESGAPAPAIVYRIAKLSVPLVVLNDGTRVTSRQADTRLEELSITDEAVHLHLLQGAARFDVTPNRKRVFKVDAGGLNVTVLGTIFGIELAPGSVRVTVERGRVRVESGREARELEAGESRSFPMQPADTLHEAVERSTALGPEPLVDLRKREARVPPQGASRKRSSPSWQALAKEGDYEAAYQELSRASFEHVQDPADLLLAADVARLTGNAAQAVPLLRRVLTAHAGDSRAALAAFTLGRMLLDQLGQPAEAAREFRRVRELAPRGALVQDAWAREVECLARIGDRSAAQREALNYLEVFPKGRRAAAVRHHAGLASP